MTEEISIFHMQVLDYLTFANDPSFESLQKIYKKAVKPGQEQWAYERINPIKYSHTRELQEELKYFEVI